MADGTLFACPGCPREDFKSVKAVKTHLEAKGHKLFCSPCQKDFKNPLSFIQHYQRHQIPHQTPHQKIDSPSGSSSVLPPPPKPPRKRAQRQLTKTLAIETTVYSNESSSMLPQSPGLWSPAEKAPEAMLTELETLNLQIEALALQPLAAKRTNRHAVLEPEEQILIRRYLLSQCHAMHRLQAQGYTVGFVAEDKKRPSIPNSLFGRTPEPVAGEEKRGAIVLDCEMVQVAEGRRELAYVTAVDFLTGEILLDHYVQPNAKVVNWDTRYSGVACKDMNKARRDGKALLGWQNARQMLWKFADAETVLIGHSLQNDLAVLGIIHTKIVDSAIVTAEAVYNDLLPGQALARTWNLKVLTKELAGYEIQNHGKQGHSAYEDTMATRDVLIWCIRNQKLFAIWSAEIRDQEKIAALEKEIAKLQAKLELEKIAQVKSRKEREKEKMEILKLTAALL